MSGQPNILWICTDQQRADTLGAYGNPATATPRLDALGDEGVVFERAYAQSPVCTPSRASFLTGRYPRTTGCRQNGQAIPPQEVLVTETLSQAGYVCGLSGKLHLAPTHPSVSPGTERRIADGYDEFHWSHHPDPDWPTNEYDQWLGERGLSFAREPVEGTEWVQYGPDAENHQTTWCAEKAIDFIEANAAFDVPWLFSVNIYDPHHAFDPPRAYLERYLDQLDEIPLPDYADGELDDKPVFQRTDHAGAYGGTAGFPYDAMSDREHRLVRAAYWAMCDLVDDQVARMLDALDRTGQREDTLVVFMSDHGEMLGDHGIYLKGPHFYEPAIHVPLIVSWPGTIPAGRRSRALVELVDVAPTLLAAAGLDPSPGMQGRSLWPLLRGETDSDHHRDDVYCEYYNAMPWHRDPAAHRTMVRTTRHKLAADHGLGSGELYDLDERPLERVNHWDDPAFAAVKAELMSRLADRMAFTVDPMPPRLARY